MNERIDAPSKLRGKNEKEQIEQIYRYLTTLSEKLNYLFLKNTDEMNSLTDKTNGFIKEQKETSYLPSGAVRDFVVNSGTSGMWTYRKWKSGIAECWGTASFVINSFYGTGGIYYTYPSSSEKPTLPFPFYKDDSGNPPVVSASCPWNYVNWVNGFVELVNAVDNAYTKCGWIYFGANSNGSGENRNIYLHVIGRWK